MAYRKKYLDVEYEDTNTIIKHVLKTIVERCKTEAAHNKFVVPLNDQEARIAYYSGLPNTSVNKLLLDKPRISMLDIQSRILILETVKCIYTQNQVPTYSTIFEEITKNGQLRTIDDELVLSLDGFVEEMTILGYLWKETIQNQKIIMEDPETRFERYMYLNKLKKFRNNSMQWQQIVYVDERLVNDSQHFPKPWLADPPPKSLPGIDECIFYHAVSKNGFITGLFSNQVSENDFSKWLTDILLMHLKYPSVIIMDSNPLHGSLENVSSITRYHSKTAMLRWLTNNNIPCSSNMSKPALYELIKKCNEDHKEYKIDRIIRSQGHEVLRLPHHFFDLSITTPLWDTIVKKGGVGITNSVMSLQSQLMKMLTEIPLLNWAEYEKTVEKNEKEIFNIDMAMEKFCDNYELKLSV